MKIFPNEHYVNVPSELAMCILYEYDFIFLNMNLLKRSRVKSPLSSAVYTLHAVHTLVCFSFLIKIFPNESNIEVPHCF